MYQFQNIVVAAMPEPRTVTACAALETANLISGETRVVSATESNDVALHVLTACDVWGGEGWNANLIVVGSRRPSRADRVMIGPTAMRLIRNSPVPVWCVRPGRIGLERTVAVAVDLESANAEVVVELGVDVANLTNSGLLLVHIVDEAALTPEIEQSVGSALQSAVAPFDHGSIAAGVRPAIGVGRVDDGIRKVVETYDVDTLILGIGRDSLGGVGEIAESLLPQLRCSVLAVPSEWKP